jgi:hypothetical protein
MKPDWITNEEWDPLSVEDRRILICEEGALVMGQVVSYREAPGLDHRKMARAGK